VTTQAATISTLTSELESERSQLMVLRVQLKHAYVRAALTVATCQLLTVTCVCVCVCVTRRLWCCWQ
jgi:hypothetical protein